MVAGAAPRAAAPWDGGGAGVDLPRIGLSWAWPRGWPTSRTVAATATVAILLMACCGGAEAARCAVEMLAYEQRVAAARRG